jgi:F-type H+-transporting ATPase subunit alpha
VSRVGGNAQTKAVKSVAKSLRIDLAQYRELAAFSQFSTDLDAETRQRIDRGERLTEMLKQPQFQPHSIWQMYTSLLAASSGCFDSIPVNKVNLAIESLFREIESSHKTIIKEVNDGAEASEATQKNIIQIAERVAHGYKEHQVVKESK